MSCMRWLPALLLTCTISFAQAGGHPGPGRWIGSTDLGGTLLYTKLILTERGGAQIHIPQRGVVYLELGVLPSSGDSIRFGRGDTLIAGHVDRNRITASISLAGEKGKLRLFGYRGLEGDAAEWPGVYQRDDGSWLLVARFGDGLQVTDLRSGAITSFWKSAETQSLEQVLPLAAVPNVGRAAFENGTLQLEANGRSTRAHRRAAWTEEDVTIPGPDSVDMAGSLKLPTRPGPHPLVIIVPGSDSQDRTVHAQMQAMLALDGNAVFAYDKRGVGRSGGSYESTEFDTLASDVVRAARWLAARTDIDTGRVFLWGHSQGAWLASMAAPQLPDLAGVVLVSGSTDTPPQQTLDWVKRHLRTRGFAESEIRDAVQYMETVFAVVRAGGAGYDELQARIEQARTSRWWGSVTQPESREDLLDWPGFFFDPIPVLRRIDVPVLAVFGSRDVNVRAQESANTTRKVLGKRVTIRVFDGADHQITLGQTGDYDLDWPSSRGYPSEYFSTITGWLRAQPRH